ncbi:MAG TPA: hypothetical protein VGQ59_22005 [Cyclobacteriaceae bacterium]|jgi:hypothetical protein|nr:hypothetical protein [Cyclobacteriaceae bacterium]
MATVIKDTPFLTGKDAEKFLDEKKRIQSKKVDLKTKERIMENFKKFSSKAKF